MKNTHFKNQRVLGKVTSKLITDGILNKQGRLVEIKGDHVKVFASDDEYHNFVIKFLREHKSVMDANPADIDEHDKRHFNLIVSRIVYHMVRDELRSFSESKFPQADRIMIAKLSMSDEDRNEIKKNYFDHRGVEMP